MKAVLFPGQGSQKLGMGGELFDQCPDLLRQADAILGYSLRDLCLKDENSRLNQTQYSQPALFAVNAMAYQAMIRSGAAAPDFVAGHSLGEYSALWAAEAFDFATGLQLVRKRGELMGRIHNGAMLALVGVAEPTIQTVLDNHRLNEIDVANYNSATQIVLSGSRHQLEAAKPIFEREGARLAMMLPVSGAFHSRFMVEALPELKRFLEQFTFSPLKIPVLSNVDGQFYSNNTIVKRLSDQLTSPVQWANSIRALMGFGLTRLEHYQEVGPGAVLIGLVRRILTECEPLTIARPAPFEPPGFAQKTTPAGVARQFGVQARLRR